MDPQSMINWQRAQKRLGEDETHLGRCTAKAGALVAYVFVWMVIYALVA